MPEEYFGRRVVYEEPRAVRIEPEYEVPRERTRYRELPPHRMPDYYNDKYEEPVSASEKVRNTIYILLITSGKLMFSNNYFSPFTSLNSGEIKSEIHKFVGPFYNVSNVMIN